MSSDTLVVGLIAAISIILNILLVVRGTANSLEVKRLKAERESLAEEKGIAIFAKNKTMESLEYFKDQCKQLNEEADSVRLTKNKLAGIEEELRSQALKLSNKKSEYETKIKTLEQELKDAQKIIANRANTDTTKESESRNVPAVPASKVEERAPKDQLAKEPPKTRSLGLSPDFASAFKSTLFEPKTTFDSNEDDDIDEDDCLIDFGKK